MLIILGILLSGLLYAIMAGVTYGYAKHCWPSHRIIYGEMDDTDRRVIVPIIWPVYWLFIWPVVKVSDVTFSRIESHAAKQIARNKVRIADLQATRAELEHSNEELESAEVELEQELARK